MNNIEGPERVQCSLSLNRTAGGVQESQNSNSLRKSGDRERGDNILLKFIIAASIRDCFRYICHILLRFCVHVCLTTVNLRTALPVYRFMKLESRLSRIQLFFPPFDSNRLIRERMNQSHLLGRTKKKWKKEWNPKLSTEMKWKATCSRAT